MKTNKIILRDGMTPSILPHLIGEVDVPYRKLVKLLGLPNDSFDDYKSDAQWAISINGNPMIIYNYKNGKNYLGKEGLPKTKITNWHIGGIKDSPIEIEIIKNALDGLK